MARTIATVVLALAFTASAFGYEGPSPLRGIKIGFSISVDSQGRYRYAYNVTNPSANDGQLSAVRLFIPWNSAVEVTLSASGLTHCKLHSGGAGEQWILQKKPMVPVGSEAPKGWDCDYGNLADYSDGAFSFAAIDDPYVVKPGFSLSGLTLISFGLPALRNVVVEPEIDLDRLPPEYGLKEKVVALEEKVKWTGQTIGPKAPPKVFDAGAFFTYLGSLKDQAVTQGWLANEPAKELTEKLIHAEKNVAACKLRSARESMRGFMEEVRESWEHEQHELKEESKERKDKDRDKKHERQPKITSEGYALLYFNGKYLLTQIENKTNLNCLPERDRDDDDGHHDRDDGKKKDR